MRKFILSALPLLAGIVVAAIVIAIVLSLENVSITQVWNALYDGAWEGASKRARVARAFLPLLLCSTGLLITFSAGLWNIGIEGQLMMGAVGASLGVLFVDLPDPNQQIALQLFLAASAGAGWALLAGILKTRGGVNEIFGGVALNFVAALLTSFMISDPLAPDSGGTGSRTDRFPLEKLLPATQVENAWISYPAIYIAAGVFIIVALMLYFSRFGLQIKAIGRSASSANALGIPTERNIWLAMTFCGICAGLGGAIIVLHPPNGWLQVNASGGIGFLALLVVLLASIRPVLVPFIVFVFAFLNVGVQRVDTELNIDPSLIAVLQGVLVLSVLLFDGVRQKVEAAQERRAIAAEAARLAAQAETTPEGGNA